MNSLLVTFDCLPASLLGCYGNLWARTPAFDRLAGESAVFQQHLAAWGGEPHRGLPWWGARPRALAREVLLPGWSFGDVADGVRAAMQRVDGDFTAALRTAGVATRRIVETRGVDPALRGFDGESVVRGRDSLTASERETPFARAVDAAIAALGNPEREPRSLVWIESAGVPVPWVSPAEFALRHVEFDAEGEGGDRVAAELERLCDPSGSASWTREEWKLARGLCAGAVRLLDEGLGRLLEAMDDSPAGGATLLIVASGRGLVLAPRADVPAAFAPLLSEAAQTPLFVRESGAEGGIRRQELVQTSDLLPTLREWFGLDAEVEGDARSLLPISRDEWGDATGARTGYVVSEQSVAVTKSREWRAFSGLGALVGKAAGDLPARLFRKPDDLWETLDLSSAFPEEAERIVAEAF